MSTGEKELKKLFRRARDCRIYHYCPHPPKREASNAGSGWDGWAQASLFVSIMAGVTLSYLRGLTSMYKHFYNLQRNPFDITPDPSFLFPTRRHNEALASLYYGVRMQKGFVVMTGEVGTGKTLLFAVCSTVASVARFFAYVFNPLLSPLEFISVRSGRPSDSLFPARQKTSFYFDLN